MPQIYSQTHEYPNQKNGWVQESDGTWSLYSPDGTLVIATRNNRAQVSEPTSDFEIANRKYVLENAGGGGASLAGLVRQGGGVNPWDGSAFPFPTSAYDPDGLWNSNTNQYVAAVPGWYQAFVYPIAGGGGIKILADGSSDYGARVALIVGGPGLNIYSPSAYAVPLLDGGLFANFATVVLPNGVTHLRAGDTLDLEADSITGTLSASSMEFALVLVAAD